MREICDPGSRPVTDHYLTSPGFISYYSTILASLYHIQSHVCVHLHSHCFWILILSLTRRFLIQCKTAFRFENNGARVFTRFVSGLYIFSSLYYFLVWFVLNAFAFLEFFPIIWYQYPICLAFSGSNKLII